MRGVGGVDGDTGAATLEFAVVLPILLMILFGIIEFGRVMMVSHALYATAREAARRAALPGADNEDVLAVITEQLAQSDLTYDSYELNPTDISTATQGDPVTVRVRINYETIAWVPGFFPGLSGWQLEGFAVMRREGFG